MKEYCVVNGARKRHIAWIKSHLPPSLSLFSLPLSLFNSLSLSQSLSFNSLSPPPLSFTLSIPLTPSLPLFLLYDIKRDCCKET